MIATASAVSTPSIPGGASSNGSSFVSGGCGRVVGGDRVDRPVGEPGEDAPRRRPSDRSGGFILNTGSNDAHAASVSVKCCGDASRGHAHARAPSPRRTRSVGARGRHVQHVVAAAGEPGELEVARHDRDLGRRGPARDAEPRRPLPLVHVAAGDEVRVLGVLRDHRAREHGRVLERTAHHVGVRHAVAVVGEHAHAEVVQLAERRELARRRGPR